MYIIILPPYPQNYQRIHRVRFTYRIRGRWLRRANAIRIVLLKKCPPNAYYIIIVWACRDCRHRTNSNALSRV